MPYRKMNKSERETIYQAGHQEWGENTTLEDYIQESLQEEERGGVRYVLVDEEDKILASLLTFPAGESNCGKYSFLGVASVIVPVEFRGNGFGKTLMQHFLRETTVLHPNTLTILYSDIDPSFYANMGFISLPEKHQHYEDTTCMVYGSKSAYRSFLKQADDIVLNLFP